MNKPRQARPLADLVRPALADALKAQGFAAADIIGRWPEIAGERLAAHSMPIRVYWPPKAKMATPDTPPEPATLILKVEGAFAFEVQMAQAQIIERVNAVFGWRCVGKLRISQGPVEHPQRAPAPRPATLDKTQAGALDKSLSGISDDALKGALARLGTAIIARKGQPPRS